MALIVGTPGPDTRGGTAATDLIVGRGGADFLSGREGDDVIFAGAGNDTVAGDNIPLPGGPFVVGPLPPAFSGTPGDNLVFAGAGNDSVIAGFGSDTVFGGTGNDTVRGYGTSAVSPSGTPGVIAADGPDWLFGGHGDDLIFGGGGADLIAGGAGQDRLVGGRGVDTLSGDAGDDVFVFGRMLEPFGSTNPALDTGVGPGHRDLVLDFHQGEDKLDLSRYENFFGPPGEQAPVFLGTDPFRAIFAPQVRYDVEHGHTVVQIVAPFGNPGSGLSPTVPQHPTAEIELTGEFHLRLEDFILRLGPEGFILS